VCTVHPAVSVVLPTFNRLEYLGAAIESVLAQTFQDWELIIADDGSDEETVQYLRRFEQPPRIQLLRLPHRGNISATRNAGVRSASGDYVAFLDSDDLWMPTKLERQMASLLSRPERKWSYTGFGIVDGSMRPLHARIGFSGATGWIAESVLSNESTVMSPSVLVRRDLLEEVGPMDEQLPFCGDFVLWMRLALRSEADCVPEPLLLVRRHGQHTGDDVGTCRDWARALDQIRPFAVTPGMASILRRQRAIAYGTLARSQASSGLRLPALASLLTSAHYAWTYQEWWRLGAGAAARIMTTKRLRAALRRRAVSH
jgi:glycosyltransferase involved in cell wall biosynthesis